MASRPGANERPHAADMEALSADVTSAPQRTFRTASQAASSLEAIAQAIHALNNVPEAQIPVTREYVIATLRELARVRDAATLDIRALAIWATSDAQSNLGLTETGVASLIGSSNSTVNRWNATGVITWEESSQRYDAEIAATQGKSKG